MYLGLDERLQAASETYLQVETDHSIQPFGCLTLGYVLDHNQATLSPSQIKFEACGTLLHISYF